MQLLIFDLDGTLIDSRLDLANAVNAAREHLHLPPLPNEKVYSYVGDGAPMLLRRALGPEAPQPEVERALGYFLDYYHAHMLDYTVLYPGVRAALERFRDSACILAVLTNKPVRISRAIVEELDLTDHFRYVYGGDSFPIKKPDPIGIHTLMRDCACDPTHTWMIGDSGVDIRAARNAGVKACGVTYGFQPHTLEEHPPDILVDDLGKLADQLLII